MIKIKGVNIFPAHIEEVIRDVEYASSEYQVMLDHLDGKDIMTLFFGVKPGCDKKQVEDAMKIHFKAKIGIVIVPKAVDIGELPRSEKKSKRIYDNRY